MGSRDGSMVRTRGRRMSSKQPPASVGTGDGEELSPEQAAERKAACQQISDGLQASVRAWNKRGKEQYEVERLRPLLQRVSLAWTRRMVKNLGQAKVVQSLVGTFLTDAKAKSPPRSRQRVRSSTRPRTEGPYATTWENGSLEEAGVDFTAAQLTKHALLDPLTQAGAKTGVVLLRRDTFEKDGIGQIHCSRPLAALLPAAEGELEQMRTEAQAKGLDTLIEVLKHAEMVHFLFGETRDGLRSRVPKRGLLVQLGTPAVTRTVAESSFDLHVSELTIFIDQAANDTLVTRATKEFRRTMTPMLLKEAGLAERMFSLKIYSVRPRTVGVEDLCKLTDADARKLVVQQAGLNQLGVFIRYTRRADSSPKDQDLPVVWLQGTTSLKEALQRGSSLSGWAGLARKADGRLGVRIHTPRDSQNLTEARQALLPASTMAPSSSLGVVGKDSYRLRGVPESDLAVLGSKLATWSTGCPVVVVRGLQGANREGEVTVVAEIPPPEWILRINSRSIPIERNETKAKQRTDFWSTSSGSNSGSRVNTANRWMNGWWEGRRSSDSRVTYSEDGTAEDVSMAPSVKRGRTDTISPSPTDRAASAPAAPAADRNEIDQVRASLAELQQQMVGLQQHVTTSAQQFTTMDQRITQCTTEVGQALQRVQPETSYKFDAIMVMLQHQQSPQQSSHLGK